MNYSELYYEKLEADANEYEAYLAYEDYDDDDYDDDDDF